MLVRGALTLDLLNFDTGKDTLTNAKNPIVTW
jgi:hypothetical protein